MRNAVIEIDGSQGEGGGQVLRSALALSMLTGRAFHITGIRGKRSKPGLLRQHLTGVHAAAQVCSAMLSPVSLGSTELTFEPGTVIGGQYEFSVGTAGSVILVLQTILPPLLIADKPSTITVDGGTHAQAAPPFEFFEQCFLPIINAMGPRVSAKLVKHGFYPAGGGRVEVQIEPAADKLAWNDLMERGALLETKGHTLVANLPGRVAIEENACAQQRLGWDDACFTIESVRDSAGPGNAQLLTARFENVTEIVTGFGKVGVSAKRVATVAATRMQGFLACRAAVGPYLADQLLMPLAMVGAGSFTTVTPSEHCRTNAAVVESFTELKVRFEQLASGYFSCTLVGS